MKRWKKTLELFFARFKIRKIIFSASNHFLGLKLERFSASRFVKHETPNLKPKKRLCAYTLIMYNNINSFVILFFNWINFHSILLIISFLMKFPTIKKKKIFNRISTRWVIACGNFLELILIQKIFSSSWQPSHPSDCWTFTRYSIYLYEVIIFDAEGATVSLERS